VIAAPRDIEDAGQILFRDPAAAVADRDGGAPVAGRELDLHGTVRGRVAYRVHDEIAHEP
jgi:hypothetical protein